MSVNQSFPEIRELLSWIGSPPRHPRQTHRVNESDSEVVDLGNGTFLASTVDSICEEVAVGLYRDPETMGWMAATASLSDLAAVGARPVGALLSALWGPGTSPGLKAGVARGFSAALKSASTYWLGGDSGSATTTTLTGVGLGLCDGRPLSRVGCKPGDWLCVTGKVGAGPALGFRFLRGEPESEYPESLYRPRARTDVGESLRSLANACMDTSDGLLSTLDTLRVFTGSGVELIWSTESLDESARRYCEERKIPLWMLWLAEHGDYQLVLSIPPNELKKAQALCPDLIPIARSVPESVSSVIMPGDKKLEIDTSFARNLLSSAGSNLREALDTLIQDTRARGLP